MINHKKIIHHVRKGKERIIAHVKKHHKKYLFWAWVAVGITALKIMAVLGLFVWVNTIIGRSQAADQTLQIHKQLAVFSILDDFIHQKYQEFSNKNDIQKENLDKDFDALDIKYHTAKNLNEKYIAAKKIVEFVIKGHELLQKLWYTTPEDDKIFNQIIYEFYQIE